MRFNKEIAIEKWKKIDKILKFEFLEQFNF